MNEVLLHRWRPLGIPDTGDSPKARDLESERQSDFVLAELGTRNPEPGIWGPKTFESSLGPVRSGCVMYPRCA